MNLLRKVQIHLQVDGSESWCGGFRAGVLGSGCLRALWAPQCLLKAHL